MNVIRPRAHSLFLFALLLLAATLLFLLVQADPVHAADELNQPADDDVTAATPLIWWVHETSHTGHAGDIDMESV